MPGFTLVLDLGPSDGWWTSPVLYPSLMGISEPSDVQHASRMIMEVLWTHECLKKKNNNNNNNNNNSICVLLFVTPSNKEYQLDPPPIQDVSQTRVVNLFFLLGLYIYCLYLPLWTWGGLKSNCLANIYFCIVSFVQAEAPKADVGGWVNIFLSMGGGFRKRISFSLLKPIKVCRVGHEIWCLIWILKPTEAPKIACFTVKHRNIKWNV